MSENRTPRAIHVADARTNNLKGLSVAVPVGKLVAVVGVSGSGKSSLAFDTLYAEGQRRYAESFSAYARQFLARLDRPDAEVEGVPAAIAIDRRPVVSTSRSTVGTLAQVLEPLRVLYATLAVLRCPGCGEEVHPDDPARAAQTLAALPRSARFAITFPASDGSWESVRADLRARGFLRVFEDGRVVDLDAAKPGGTPREGGGGAAAAGAAGGGGPPRSRDIVVDRLTPGAGARRIQDSLEQAFREGNGKAAAHLFSSAGTDPAAETLRFSRGLVCARCDRAFEEPRPRAFSWNSPIGACPACRGFGRTLEIDPALVIPDPRRSLAEGAIRPWTTGSTEEERRALRAFCKRRKIDAFAPWQDLPEEHRKLVASGDSRFDGVLGWFRWLETKTYKMHVRVLLSRYRTALPCRACSGQRLRPEALAWLLDGKTIADLTALPVSDALAFLDGLVASRASARDLAVAEACLREVRGRLAALAETGLSYLELDRPSRTLSGGELERVHLAAALGASLSETLFVLDEPSVGLHARDVARLVGLLRALVAAGNTVLLVEHDPELIEAADHVLEIGPGAGAEGGELVFEGSVAALKEDRGSRTGAFLAGRERVTRARHAPGAAAVSIQGARVRTLQDVSARFPLGALTVVCGVSGSGKSTLLEEVLAPSWRSARSGGAPVGCDRIEGAELVSDLLLVGQDPVGRTPRANALSYTKAADDVRAIFASTEAARHSGFRASHFSLNAEGGRCERCAGDGHERIEMQFLAPVFVRCEECQGRRFRDELLAVTDRGRSIAQVLDMPVREGLAFYAHVPAIVSKLAPLEAVGLGYLRLGQPLNTLSGGEAQRLKLAHHLGAAAAEGARGAPLLLVLDEPTAGLHLADVQALLRALDALVKAGHAVVVVEHHLDVIAAADHVLELGPGGGPAGGRKVYEGDFEGLLRCKESPTAEVLGRPARKTRRREGAAEDAEHAEVEVSASLGVFGGSRKSSRGAAPASADAIRVRGAREHNLKAVDLDLPRRSLTVVTGPSGSGKSTLAFDVLFREGQRRYLDTLSPYARQFVARGERPEVDALTGVPPTVAIEQRTSRYGRMSTVATVVELHPWLRVLYANAGVAHCPRCRVAIAPETVDSLAKRLVRGFGGSEALVLAPVVRSRKGHHRPVFEKLEKAKRRTVEVDGTLFDLADGYPECDRYREHDIAVAVSEGVPQKGARAVVEEALAIGEGSFKVRGRDGSSVWFSAARACPSCGTGFEPLDVRLFTWTARKGRCRACAGQGVAGPWYEAEGVVPDDDAVLTIGDGSSWREASPTGEREPCPECHGSRLNEIARSVKLGGLTLPELCALPVEELAPCLEALERGLDARGRAVARPLLRGVRKKLAFLAEVGLGYLSLDRSADTLSGGEAQRLRLAAQLGAGLTGVLYVLDEPTIGLHPRDSEKLVRALCGLRDGGNTVLVVEHDERVMRAADFLVDLGPGAGREGGEIVARGTVAEVEADPASLTGRFLSGLEPSAAALGKRRPIDGEAALLRGARVRNLKDVDLRVPLGTLVAVSGVSGSGKSTLVRDVFLRAVLADLKAEPAPPGHRSLEGARAFARAAEVDQSPIGRTPRSVPATYVGIFDTLRDLFAQTTEARAHGFGRERFSFNASAGRCAECQGQGRVRVEMAFLPAVEIPCEGCSGARFDRTTLEAKLGGRSIAQVLALTVREALEAFAHVPKLERCLSLLDEVGLGYLQLGQPSTQLSGGEAQRLKLVRELSKKARGRSLYVLDEPTTGLHAHDVAKLVRALQRLVDRGDTVVVIEHNLDVIAASDLVYDLGPEGGAAGGEVVACGAPADVARKPGRSHTARLLREVLAKARRPVHGPGGVPVDEGTAGNGNGNGNGNGPKRSASRRPG